MRIRAAAITLGTTLAGAAAAVTLSAGTASAFTPIVNRDGIIAGAALDHNETAALANSPVPALLDQVLPQPRGLDVEGNSQLVAHDGRYDTDLPSVFGEAAAAPDGRIGLAILDPNLNNGLNTLVVEDIQ